MIFNDWKKKYLKKKEKKRKIRCKLAQARRKTNHLERGDFSFHLVWSADWARFDRKDVSRGEEERKRSDLTRWLACQRDLRARLPGTWVRIAGIGREDERKDIPGEPRHGTVAGQPSWQIIVGAAARREVCEEAFVDE